VGEYNIPIDKKQIVKIVVPVTLSSMLIPLSRVADSFMILNILKKYLSNATSVYGIYTGGVESVIGVPVAICYGFAVAGIPIISSLKVDSPLLAKKKSTQVFFYTAFLGVVFTILAFLFSELIVKVLYFNLSLESKNLMENLIRVASVSILALALLQTSSAILVSFGRLYTPCITLGVGVVVKIILSLILLPKPSINIYATAISDIICYALALLLNSYFIFKPV
jgi:stage V sporulation protein B